MPEVRGVWAQLIQSRTCLSPRVRSPHCSFLVGPALGCGAVSAQLASTHTGSAVVTFVPACHRLSTCLETWRSPVEGLL